MMPALKVSIVLLIVLASARSFGQEPVAQEAAAHPAPVEGVWCFDVVGSVDAIHVLTGDLHAQTTSVWYSRSHDGGQRWTGSVRVDTGLPAPQPSLLRDHARIAANPDRLLVMWPGLGGIAVAASMDGGRSWQRETVADGELGTRRSGAIVAGDAGSLHALARAATEGATGLFYRTSTDGGRTWQQAAKLAGADARNPDLVRASDGMLAAVWEEASGPESTIFYALSLDDGKSWGTRTKLSDGGSEATHPRVVVTKDGYLVLWLERWRSSERVLQRGYIGVQHRH